MSPVKSTRRKARESAQRYAHRRQSHDVVVTQWERGGNRCAGCGLVEVGHLFGRRNIISEPWASSPKLCAALCCARTWGDRIGCHELADRNLDPELRDRLRWAAVRAFAADYGIRAVRFDREGDPVAAIRACERELREREAVQP